MTHYEHHVPRVQFIREACVHLSEDELVEAEKRFFQYIQIVRRIAQAKHGNDEQSD